MRILPVLFCAAALCLLAACTKPTTTPVSDVPIVSFTNKLDRNVVVRLADSFVNAPFYLTIHPNERVVVPVTRFPKSKTLTYYWATEDLSMSSWYLRENAFPRYTSVKVVDGKGEDIVITPVSETNKLLYCLEGIDEPTNWTAVDAFKDFGGASIWDKLPVSARNKTVRLTHTKHAVYNDGTATATMPYTFAEESNSSSRFMLSANNDKTGIVMTNDLRPLSYTRYSASLDTLFMKVGMDDAYYVMVRSRDNSIQYRFVNKTGVPITVRIGDTTNEQAYKYLSIAANGSAYTDAVLHDAAWYWMADDFSMGDWYLKTPAQWMVKPYIVKTEGGKTIREISILPTRNRNDARYCLNGMDAFTQWIFVNAFDTNGNSIWATLTPDKKFQRVILRFNRMGSIMGASSHESGFEYELVDSTAAFVLKNTPNYISPVVKAGNYLRMTNDLRGTAPLYTTSTDTLYLSLGGGAPYYLLVKQR